MIQSIGNLLELLSKYGLIDIVFGIGIFTYIAKRLKGKTKSDLLGIDLLPHINSNENVFTLVIKNQSNQVLYLYQAYIKPGYFKNRNRYWMDWETTKFPKIKNRPKTTKGLYILQIRENINNLSPTLFIEPYQSKEYILEFDELAPTTIDDPNEIFENKQFGILKLQFVHGTNSGVLEMQL